MNHDYSAGVFWFHDLAFRYHQIYWVILMVGFRKFAICWVFPNIYIQHDSCLIYFWCPIKRRRSFEWHYKWRHAFMMLFYFQAFQVLLKHHIFYCLFQKLAAFTNKTFLQCHIHLVFCRLLFTEQQFLPCVGYNFTLWS